MQVNKKSGGKREGAGRPKTDKEETITIAFRVPISLAEEIKVMVKKKLTTHVSR